MKLAVIIPAYNEEATIADTLRRLAHSPDRDFDVVICDNASTDGTRQAIDAVIAEHELAWTVITETQKGTGAAADSAAREAIRRGATHIARTDADCLPAHEWIQSIKRAFRTVGGRGSDTPYFVAGVSYPRTDDTGISLRRARVLTVVNEVAIWFGRVRPSNFGGRYRGPYMMTSGNNLAITAELYEAVGGFTRTAIEDVHEDRELIQAVRRVTHRYRLHRDVVVYASARRIEQWGIVRSLLWYAGHYFRPELVDLR